MNDSKNIFYYFELHSVEGMRKCFENGVNPNARSNDKPLINIFISYYTRTPRFAECIKTFVEYGLEFSDKILLSVLLNDSSSLDNLLSNNMEAVHKTYSLRSAYTPLYRATLLHICAEFNHVACAEILVKHGADINAKAGVDENGFGGQMPIFHTVNQNSNNSFEMLNYLLSKSADLNTTVTGILWGKSYEWETLIPSVNPVSYAMMGLLPQMHRDEITISMVVSLLLKKAHGIEYAPQNVPCAYLIRK